MIELATYLPKGFHPECEGRQDLFFTSENRYTSREAKQICARCPFAAECLEMAMEAEVGDSYRYGVYGGLTPNQRKELQRQRGPVMMPCPHCGTPFPKWNGRKFCKHSCKQAFGERNRRLRGAA